MQLAQINQKQQADLAAEVKYYATDVTDFRAANDQLDLESIPLSTALAIIGNVKRVLRTCGTTAFRTQGDLKGHYNRTGDGVANAARMAHTKQGSFIIPVLVRLSLEPRADTSRHLIDVGPPEAVERRVTRTMAEALRAVEKTVVEPGTEPTADRLHTAIEMGVSKELCVALHNLLNESVVGELDTTFNWAPAATPPATAPRRVTIPAESRDLIQMAAKKLKNVRVETSRTMTGPIVGLRHTPQAPYGEITISTIRDGRQAEVTVRLPYEGYYRPAIEWHRDRRVLIVEGFVEGGPGHRLYVAKPGRCEPLEDLFTQPRDRPRSSPSLEDTPPPLAAPSPRAGLPSTNYDSDDLGD
ncbi:hypothetical protein [Pseudonocardia sp. McavD-2-B]|uniref:hypothetical protein n=1 Tax=Pseudonocardia sp. McavD-2-B TaxID=2954499 RepID=UPI0020983898|nr:hypothetical protein [Pseudonocardia sp. McavD-2-B]MCO7192561.1 hypothetical protein [Pseudonocardia sp. McavD-2-B]